jgi:hypothetical protein
LVEDGSLVVSECLFDEPCLSEPAATVHDGEFRFIGIEVIS